MSNGETFQQGPVVQPQAKKAGFMEWLRGKNRREFLEHLSYLVFGIAAILLFLGILLGSFVKYTVYLASLGAFLLLAGIILYIGSQLVEE